MLGCAIARARHLAEADAQVYAETKARIRTPYAERIQAALATDPARLATALLQPAVQARLTRPS